MLSPEQLLSYFEEKQAENEPEKVSKRYEEMRAAAEDKDKELEMQLKEKQLEWEERKKKCYKDAHIRTIKKVWIYI